MLNSDASKAEKEAFVTGHTGGEYWEILLLQSLLPAFLLIEGVLLKGFVNITYRPAQWLIDFIFVVIPLLCSMTILTTEYTRFIIFIRWCLTLIVISAAVVTYAAWRHKVKSPSSKGPVVYRIDSSANAGSYHNQRHIFLGWYRSSLMIATCMAILAVDFNVFPRRFAKVEEYGISLMDVGVGAFIASSGIVWKPFSMLLTTSMAPPPTVPRFVAPMHGLATVLMQWLRRTVQVVLPVLLAGVTRLLLVKATNYQEHVSEYGTHWNFFITLSVVFLIESVIELFKYLLLHFTKERRKPVVAKQTSNRQKETRTVVISYASYSKQISLSRLQSSSNLLLAIIFLAVYEIALRKLKLAEYILHAPRVDLFSSNREGIISCIGYVSLFWFGQYVGEWLRESKNTTGPVVSGTPLTPYTWAHVVQLVGTGAFLWFLEVVVFEDLLFMRPSRRLCNASYATYIAIGTLVTLGLLLAVELTLRSLLSSRGISYTMHEPALEDMNLILKSLTTANVLTGLINLLLGATHKFSDLSAMVVLICYSLVLSLLATFVPRVVVGINSRLYSKNVENRQEKDFRN